MRVVKSLTASWSVIVSPSKSKTTVITLLYLSITNDNKQTRFRSLYVRQTETMHVPTWIEVAVTLSSKVNEGGPWHCKFTRIHQNIPSALSYAGCSSCFTNDRPLDLPNNSTHSGARILVPDVLHEQGLSDQPLAERYLRPLLLYAALSWMSADLNFIAALVYFSFMRGPSFRNQLVL